MVTGAGQASASLVTARLAPEPASVGLARRWLREALAGIARDDLVDDAVLVVSELVTNAVVHAGTPIDLDVTYAAPQVRVTVSDGSRRFPQLRDYGTQAGTGRGLRLVQNLTDGWGYDATPDGKRVWFLISQARPEDADPVPPVPVPGCAPTEPEPSAQEVVLVELRDMPLLLHAAWREQAQPMLREMLLVQLAGPAEDVAEAVRRHAETTDAIGLLDESIPRVHRGFAHDRLIDPSVEPDVTLPLVTLPVPLASVGHFATLREVGELARELATQGRLLTPPTLPELRSFREWICEQVSDQALGYAPQPWVMPADASLRPVTPAREAASASWRWVADSDRGIVVADAEGVMVAVSGPAADLLGYGHSDAMVGLRLVQIVPERFRQAHLAGMTLYLVSGRQPILGPLLTLPALRRDGSEITVQVTLRSEDVPGGRPVVVAELDAVPDAGPAGT